MADDVERLAALVEVVRRLRSPSGCPWDREQTHASLRATLLEEAYEVLEAIDEKSIVKLREELVPLCSPKAPPCITEQNTSVSLLPSTRSSNKPSLSKIRSPGFTSWGSCL